VVGDRKEDVLGAQHHGFAGIGVAWGYADEGELESVNPTAIVGSAVELRQFLGF
jgi:phosphoglycolate phosphatase